MDTVTKYQCKTEAFKWSFFSWAVTKWNSLDNCLYWKKKKNYWKFFFCLTLLKRGRIFISWRISISLRHWNTGLVSSGVNLTSWGEGASVALVAHPYSDCLMIKKGYGVDVLLHWPACTSSFPIWLVKTKSDFIVRSAETSLGRWMLVVVVISVAASPFLAWEYRCFLVALCWLIVRRPNLEVATKRLLHRKVKILG